MPEPIPPVQVQEIVLAPQWSTGVVFIDGQVLRALHIQHPRFGLLSFALTRDSKAELIEGLGKIEQMVEDQQKKAN